MHGTGAQAAGSALARGLALSPAPRGVRLPLGLRSSSASSPLISPSSLSSLALAPDGAGDAILSSVRWREEAGRFVGKQVLQCIPCCGPCFRRQLRAGGRAPRQHKAPVSSCTSCCSPRARHRSAHSSRMPSPLPPRCSLLQRLCKAAQLGAQLRHRQAVAHVCAAGRALLVPRLQRRHQALDAVDAAAQLSRLGLCGEGCSRLEAWMQGTACYLLPAADVCL